MSNLKPEQIVQYLEQHPELLATLRIPHASGASSLIERQVEQLRRENRQLTQKLRQLTGIAGENERLMRRLHRMALELMAAASPHSMFCTLVTGLQQEFDADAVRVLLGAEQAGWFEHEAIGVLPNPVPDWVDAILADNQACCGRLTRDKRALLFGDSQIGSVAVIPLDEFGLLAIGSNSDERFHPEMGTLFLQLLGQTLQSRLRRESRPKGAARQAQA